MIYSLIHPGSGLGNQLHRIIMAKVLSMDKGYRCSFIGAGYFKGSSFMNIEFGLIEPKVFVSIENGGKIQVRENIPLWQEWDKHCYDPDINFVEDNTIIDGNFEDERYFSHRLKEIRTWLKVEPFEVSEDTCVINFRGGEYQYIPELFLTKDYWDLAIKKMKDIGIEHFIVATDDVPLAQQFFPQYECIHNIGENWRMLRYAHYIILSNSSFAILPTFLNENAKYIIAPKYWNRRNVKRWDYPQGYYTKYTYI